MECGVVLSRSERRPAPRGLPDGRHLFRDQVGVRTVEEAGADGPDVVGELVGPDVADLDRHGPTLPCGGAPSVPDRGGYPRSGRGPTNGGMEAIPHDAALPLPEGTRLLHIGAPEHGTTTVRG